MQPFDIIACGMNVVDNIFVLPEAVRKNEKHPVEQMMVQGGGPGANQACGTAALGWRTAFLTRLGENTVSLIAEAEFRRFGVSLDLAVRMPSAPPAMAVVEVDPDTGERTVFYNLDGYNHLSAGDVPAHEVRAARLVITDAYEAAAASRLLELAAEAGIPGVLDLEVAELSDARRLLAAASHAILSIEAGRQLTACEQPAAVLTTLTEWTTAQLVVTDGVNGAWAMGPRGVIHQPAFLVAAMDTTGCGDAFHAAYASALLDGLKLSLRLEFAAWYASFTALELGARSRLPTRAALRDADLSQLSPRLRAHILRRVPVPTAVV